MICGTKVILRPVLDSDLGSFREWDDDNEIIQWAGKKFLSEHHIYIWYDSLRKDRTRIALSILQNNGNLIGEMELEHISWRNGTAELKIFIGEKRLWNQGYGTDAINTLMSYIEARTMLSEIYLRVAKDNVRAVRCYKKCGFVARGILKAGKRKTEGHQDLVLMLRPLKRKLPASSVRRRTLEAD